MPLTLCAYRNDAALEVPLWRPTMCLFKSRDLKEKCHDWLHQCSY